LGLLSPLNQIKKQTRFTLAGGVRLVGPFLGIRRYFFFFPPLPAKEKLLSSAARKEEEEEKKKEPPKTKAKHTKPITMFSNFPKGQKAKANKPPP
jgi:hypothetical protein